MKDHRIVQRGGTVHIPRIQIRTRSEQRLNTGKPQAILESSEER